MWEWLKSPERRQREAQERSDREWHEEQERAARRERDRMYRLGISRDFEKERRQSSDVARFRPATDDSDGSRVLIGPGAVIRSREQAEKAGLTQAWDAMEAQDRARKEAQERHDAIDAVQNRAPVPIPHVGGELRGHESSDSQPRTPDEQIEVIQAAAAAAGVVLVEGEQEPVDAQDRPMDDPRRLQGAVEAIQEAVALTPQQVWEQAPEKPQESRVHDLEGTEWRVWSEDGMVKFAWDEGRSQAQFSQAAAERIADGIDKALIQVYRRA